MLNGLKSDLGKYPFGVVVLRSLRRSRAIAHATMRKRLYECTSYRRHLTACMESDVLVCLSHRSYLARGLTAAQRLEMAYTHYQNEDLAFNQAYRDAVYDGQGLVLWQAVRDEVSYELRLLTGNDVMYEGGLSIVLTVDGARVCVMSFSTIPSHIPLPAPASLGLEPGLSDKILFITRKQLTQQRDYQAAFNKAFDRCTPAHLCFGALSGIAAAQGISFALGVSPEKHASYKKDAEEKFRVSYAEFWQSLGGRHVTPLGYLMSLPPELHALGDMTAARRKRAKLRRAHIDAIRLNAQQVIAQHLNTADAT